MFDGSSTRRATTRTPTAGAPLRSSTRPRTTAPRDKRMSSSRAGARAVRDDHDGGISRLGHDQLRGRLRQLDLEASFFVGQDRAQLAIGALAAREREGRAHFAIGLIAACNPDGRAAERPIVGIGDDAAANHDRRRLSRWRRMPRESVRRSRSCARPSQSARFSVRGPGRTGQRISSASGTPAAHSGHSDGFHISPGNDASVSRARPFSRASTHRR